MNNLDELEQQLKAKTCEPELVDDDDEEEEDTEAFDLLYDTMTFMAYLGNQRTVTEKDQEKMLKIADKIWEFLIEEGFIVDESET